MRQRVKMMRYQAYSRSGWDEQKFHSGRVYDLDQSDIDRLSPDSYQLLDQGAAPDNRAKARAPKNRRKNA